MSIKKIPEAYKPDPRCKICKIFNKDKELWQKIHIKVIQDGLSRAAVCTWANASIEVLNKSLILDGEEVIPLLTTENFHTHFNKHVTENLNELWMLRKESENTSASRGYGTVDPEQTQLAGAYITNLAANGNPMNSFATMQTMVEALKIQINAYTNYFQNFSQDHSGNLPDIRQVEVYQRLVAGYLQAEQDLVKIKNSGEITGKAIEEVLWKISSDLSLKIKEIAESVRLRLQDVMDGTSLPIEIENMIKMQFIEHAKMVIPDIVNKVKKEFKLQ